MNDIPNCSNATMIRFNKWLTPSLRWYSTRGKKIKPEKPNIVVLDPRQAGLTSNKKVFLSNSDYKWRNSTKNSTRMNTLFEGIELEHNNSSEKFSNKITDLSEETEKLLKFKTIASTQQVNQSIDSFKPTVKNISQEDYLSIEKQLTDSFTIKQLRAYVNELDPNHNLITSHRLVKHKLIQQIFNKLWNGQISNVSINLQTKTIKLSQRHSKLLLLTHNGKILRNLARLNLNLFIQLNLSQNELKITSTNSILRFIEVSLNNILNNVCVTDWAPTITLNENQLNLITRICGVDINNNEIAAFGWKRIRLAERLVAWIQSNDNKFNKNEQIETWLNTDAKKENIKWYPFNDIDSLNWLSKNENWGRFQQTNSLNTEQDNIMKPIDIISEEKIDKLYEFFKNSKTKDSVNLKSQHLNIFSVSMGQIIENNNANKHLFQPKISNFSNKILQLPPDTTSIDESMTDFINEPSYYLELNFSPSQKNEIKNAPPIKLLSELDENNNIIYETIQCLTYLSTDEYLIKLPQLSHDYKITQDKVSDIIEYDSNDALINQPGLSEFLNKFSFSPLKSFEDYIDKLEVNLPLSTDTKASIEYEFVSLNHHSMRRFRYLDKYPVQFSKVNGGPLGGSYTQIEFINDKTSNNMISRDEFSQFIKDIFKLN